MDWETLKADCLACSRCELCKTRPGPVCGKKKEPPHAFSVQQLPYGVSVLL